MWSRAQSCLDPEDPHLKDSSHNHSSTTLICGSGGGANPDPTTSRSKVFRLYSVGPQRQVEEMTGGGDRHLYSWFLRHSLRGHKVINCRCETSLVLLFSAWHTLKTQTECAHNHPWLCSENSVSMTTHPAWLLAVCVSVFFGLLLLCDEPAAQMSLRTIKLEKNADRSGTIIDAAENKLYPQSCATYRCCIVTLKFDIQSLLRAWWEWCHLVPGSC